MCLTGSKLRGLNRYNWDGDEIIHDCIVPSSRPVVGVPGSRNYDIDVREFLITDKNDLLKKTIDDALRRHVSQAYKGGWEMFQQRTPKSFDFRAHMIASFVGETIAYEEKGVGKPWLFPDETLFVKKGDCEDSAFLIASLMIAAGVSPYNVRVAIGKMKVAAPSGSVAFHDHVWVMYKSENGRWIVIEPLRAVKMSKAGKMKDHRKIAKACSYASYVPSFVFNDAHLWTVRSGKEPLAFAEQVGKEWSKLNPTFHGEVHKTIVDTALQNAGAPDWFIQAIDRHFSFGYLGIPLLDDVDFPIIHEDYHPFDHFDDAYITESWKRVNDHLGNFRKDNTDVDDFAFAAHGIADFYAHTSYIHFAKIIDPKKESGHAAPCDPANPVAGLARRPNYDAGSDFDLTKAKFSTNSDHWENHKSDIPALWNGQLISGRYGQYGDSDFLAKIPVCLRNADDYEDRKSLPHHDELAVDKEDYSTDNELYTDALAADERGNPTVWSNQFAWRKNTAIIHIAEVFKSNRGPNLK